MRLKGLTKLQWALGGILFIVCLAGAWKISTNECPDEFARQLLTNYIYKNNRLPYGREPEIIIGTYGFSYALRPYLTSMIGALFMKIISIFSTGEHALLFASRLCSVFSVSICFFYCCKLGNMLFHKSMTSTLFAVMIGYLPQVMFLGMYQNNDIFSLMCVVMLLYYFLIGQKNNWAIRDCIVFAIVISVAFLSYYSIYGWLLTGGIVFLYQFLRNKAMGSRDKIIKLCIISGIVFVLAGWFFIRNAVIHNGDFFGIATENVWRAELREQGVEIQEYYTPCDKENNSFLKFFMDSDYIWLRFTQRSFIGLFGYMNLHLSQGIYDFYYACFAIGILCFLAVAIKCTKTKEDKTLFLILFLSSMITIGLSLYQSYFRDYQPQGRYIISVAILLSYMTAYSSDRIHVNLLPQKDEAVRGNHTVLNTDMVFGILWILMFFRVFFETFPRMFM